MQLPNGKPSSVERPSSSAIASRHPAGWLRHAHSTGLQGVVQHREDLLTNLFVIDSAPAHATHHNQEPSTEWLTHFSTPPPCRPEASDVPITRVTGDEPRSTHDQLAIEEPLEIRLAFGPRLNRSLKPISITMRTPGPEPEDFELALGFLFTEGIIQSPEQVDRYYYCGPETGGQLHLRNVVRIELHPSVDLDLGRLERHFYTTSSCGVCGKTSIDALRTVCQQPLSDGFTVSSDVIHALPRVPSYVTIDIRSHRRPSRIRPL